MRRTPDELVRVHLRYALLHVFPTRVQHIERAPLDHDSHGHNSEDIVLEFVFHRLCLLYLVG